MERYEKRWHKAIALEHQLGTRPHQVCCSFERPHHLMNLSIASFCVLATGEHIQRWTIPRVVTEQELFPCDELWGIR